MSNKNNDFNFEEFSVKVIQYIDSLRSILTWADKSQIKDGADAKPKESRINAFYRAVGLPAVIPPKREKDDPYKEEMESLVFRGGTRPDKYNNGNLHEIDFEIYEKDLNERQDNFNLPPTDKEIEELDSFEGHDLFGNLDLRKRGGMFPMVVDGRIRVMPQKKRIAGAFMSDDLRKSKADQKVLYHQPLIETILYIRLKGANVVNTKEQQSTTEALEIESIKKLAYLDLTSLTGLNKDVENRIEKTLNCIGPVLKDAVQLWRKARSKTGIKVVPVVPATAQQNPKTTVVSDSQYKLDIQKAEQEDKQAVNDVILSLFEYEAIDRRNIRGGALAGSLIEILSPDPKKKSVSKKENKSVNKKLEKEKANVKESYRSMELLFGTFAGISGTDILAVMIALYRIESKYLVALLNESAQERLAKVKGGVDIPELEGAKDIKITEAINELQNKVTDVFIQILDSTNADKHDNDPKNNA